MITIPLKTVFYDFFLFTSFFQNGSFSFVSLQICAFTITSETLWVSAVSLFMHANLREFDRVNK